MHLKHLLLYISTFNYYKSTIEPGSRTIREQVLDMIQEGVDWNGSVLGLYNTCWWSSYSQYFALNCGDDAESYYEEFDYNEGLYDIL